MSDREIRRLSERRGGDRHRSQRLCLVIVEGRPETARLRNISATGAFVETNARPRLGHVVQLRHPEAGAIDAEVVRHARDGVALAFTLGEPAVTFALSAISADMTQPGTAAGAGAVNS